MKVLNQVEEWRPIADYDGCYSVSNFGNIRSEARHFVDKHGQKSIQERILKPCKSSSGYLFVNLSRENKVSHAMIHRLVANAFLENPEGLRCVNHKDEDKCNNRADNLEWCTYKYNANYGKRNAKIGDGHAVKIMQKDLKGHIIKIWDSAVEACRHNDFTRSGISQCLNQRIQTYKGFKFERV
ncbi:MAG: HNH endonuclease [Prevotella sp.]|nr:HNH endonuclease [Prevotella sp.]